MRAQILAVLAASAALSLVAVETASAEVITETKTVSDGFTTCRAVKQTQNGPLGSSSQTSKVCRQNVVFGGGGPVVFPNGNTGVVGPRHPINNSGGNNSGGGLNINIRF
jgi:hypothetical protein